MKGIRKYTYYCDRHNISGWKFWALNHQISVRRTHETSDMPCLTLTKKEIEYVRALLELDPTVFDRFDCVEIDMSESF